MASPAAPAPAAAPSAPAPSSPGAAGPQGLPQVRSADSFFSGADEPEVAEPGDSGQPGQPGQQAAAPPADPLEALLQSASPEQREQAKKAIDALRSTQGRAKAEAQQRREIEAIAQRNHEAGQAWQRMAQAILARARAQGVDVSDLEQMAGPGGGDDAPGREVEGMGADEFSQAVEPLWEQHLGEKSAWTNEYQQTLGQIDGLLRMARQANEAGDTAAAQQFAQQARALNMGLQRTTARASMQPVLALVYALGRQVAAMRGESRAQQSTAEEMREARAIFREAATSNGLAKDESTGAYLYPGLFEPGTMKATEQGRNILDQIGKWCWDKDLDPRDPEVFADAYHAVLRRNPSLATKPQDGSAGARTPGGDASLGGGLGSPGPGAGSGRGSLTGAPDSDVRLRRNVNAFGRR